MARKDITFPLKDAAGRDDVHTSSETSPEVLRDQVGNPAFLAEVEGDRQVALGRRTGDTDAAVSLVARTQPRGGEVKPMRVFSTWFQMVNMAEKVHRVRRRRHT